MFVNFSMLIERKLAANMFTDIAGYTALSNKDSHTLPQLENSKLFQEIISLISIKKQT